ncbi:U6 snRNP-associated protein Lsm7 [Leucoagaricus gongylophorus]
MADRGRGGIIPNTSTRSGTLGANDKPKREAILDLSKYVNESIRVKLMGGRQVEGKLKGYDQLLNLVLDDVEEYFQEPEPHTRSLGLVVVRGPLITIVSPVDGSEEIANPFTVQE